MAVARSVSPGPGDFGFKMIPSTVIFADPELDWSGVVALSLQPVNAHTDTKPRASEKAIHLLLRLCFNDTSRRRRGLHEPACQANHDSYVLTIQIFWWGSETKIDVSGYNFKPFFGMQHERAAVGQSPSAARVLLAETP